MKRIRPVVKLSGWFLVLSFVLAGCVSQPPFPENILDTPELYLSNGFKLIHRDRYDDAEREFNKALRHDSKNSGAYAGLALVKGHKGEREAALTFMTRSASLARSAEEEYRVYVGWIRLHTVLKGKDWIKEAEKAYSWACYMRKDCPDAHYYMGLAYKSGYRVEEARAAFLKVLELRKSLALHAENELRILKKIESARPRSDFGKRLVVADQVTRAEVAGLFFHELAIQELLKKSLSGSEKNRFNTNPSAMAPDIGSHPLKGSLEKIVDLQIKGLSVHVDGTFGPNEVVTRAAFSTMMADIISRAVNDPRIAVGYAGKGSPFLDVKNDAPYLEAIHVCMAWGGGLESENEIFNPMGALTGYDAILSIHNLMNRLKPS